MPRWRASCSSIPKALHVDDDSLCPSQPRTAMHRPVTRHTAVCTAWGPATCDFNGLSPPGPVLSFRSPYARRRTAGDATEPDNRSLEGSHTSAKRLLDFDVPLEAIIATDLMRIQSNRNILGCVFL